MKHGIPDFRAAAAAGQTLPLDVRGETALPQTGLSLDRGDRPRWILRLLDRAVHFRLPVRLNGPGLGRGLQTRLLGVDRRLGLMMIGHLLDYGDNHLIRKNRDLNLVLDHEGRPALCSTRVVGTATCRQNTCHVAPVPSSIVCMELREGARTALPGVQQAVLQVDAESGERMALDVVDIGAGGLGLVIPHLPLRGIRNGERWARCRLETGHGRSAPFGAVVRHRSISAAGQSIGIAIDAADDVALQRWRHLAERLQGAARPFPAADAVAPAPTFSMRYPQP